MWHRAGEAVHHPITTVIINYKLVDNIREQGVTQTPAPGGQGVRRGSQRRQVLTASRRIAIDRRVVLTNEREMGMAEIEEMQRRLFGPSSRRGFLRAGLAGGAGLAAAAVIGCGGDDDDDEPSGGTGTQAPGATGTSTQAEPDYVTRAREEGSPYPYNYEEPDKTPKAGGT